MVFWSLIFKFLERRREDKRLWTEQQQAIPESNLPLIYSWMLFWLVTVIPKYLNFATYSKDLLVVNYDFVLHFGDKTQPYTYAPLSLSSNQITRFLNFWVLHWTSFTPMKPFGVNLERTSLWPVVQSLNWAELSYFATVSQSALALSPSATLDSWS
jgi:hypothetical protein